MSPTHWLSRRWAGLTSFALLVLLCWLLANWTWIFWPRPKISPLDATQQSSNATPVSVGEIAARHLFGEASTEAAVAAPVVVASPLNAKLKGVFAGLPPFPAFAILNFDGKDQPVRVGAEIVPGAVLDSVHPRHVLVRRNGAIEKLEFENATTAGTPGAPVAQLSSQLAARPASPSQFRLNVQSLNQNTSALSRAELQSALQDPRQLTNIGRVQDNPGGGVSVQEAAQGSLLQKLGLLDGDVIRSLNGVPVNSQADLMRLYQHFGQAGQVKVEGLRAGTPLQLNYNIRQ